MNLDDTWTMVNVCLVAMTLGKDKVDVEVLRMVKNKADELMDVDEWEDELVEEVSTRLGNLMK